MQRRIDRAGSGTSGNHATMSAKEESRKMQVKRNTGRKNNKRKVLSEKQGGRSCAKARRAFAEKYLFGSKTVFLGQEVHYYWSLSHIIFSKICKFAITRKNDAFVAKIVNTRLTKIFMANFAFDERLPTSAILLRRRDFPRYQVPWLASQDVAPPSTWPP